MLTLKHFFTAVFISYCFVSCSGCQQDDPEQQETPNTPKYEPFPYQYNLESKEEYFAEMNLLLGKAIQQAKSIVPGDTLENNPKLDRIKDILNEVIDLKFESFDQFPGFWDRPFKDWYMDFESLDFAFDMVVIIASDSTTEEDIKQRRILDWLNIAKEIKEDIERSVEPFANDPFHPNFEIMRKLRSMNGRLEMMIDGFASNETDDFLIHELKMLHYQKLRTLHYFPNVDGLPFEVWYRNLAWLDRSLDLALKSTDTYQRGNYHEDNFHSRIHLGSLIFTLERAKEAKEKLHRRRIAPEEEPKHHLTRPH